MNKVIDEVDNLIDMLNNTDFVKNMASCKKKIISESLINTTDVKELYKNPVIHEYVTNQNTLDYHILYLNKEISKLLNNKVCR